MGQQLLIDAFIVVIVGGLGSLGGTVAGAYLVGTVDTVSQYFVGPVLVAGDLVRGAVLRVAGAADRPAGEGGMTASRSCQAGLVLRIAVIGLVAILLVAVPLVVKGGYYDNVLVLACVFATLASNWDLSIGYAGIFTFGQIAVFGVGAYTTAILTTHYGMSPWLALVASIVVGTAVAAITALPAIRLRGIYVALATFAFTELIVNVIVSNDWTGGQLGITALPDLTVGKFDLSLSDGGIGLLYLAEALLVASTVFLRLIVRSNLGRGAIAARLNRKTMR